MKKFLSANEAVAHAAAQAGCVVASAYPGTPSTEILENIAKFKDTINEKHREVNKLKESNDIINEFENFKDTYLNKPLVSLEAKIQKLLKNCDDIQRLNESNRISMNEILTSTIETMKIKIERFDIKKIERKVKKLEAQED